MRQQPVDPPLGFKVARTGGIVVELYRAMYRCRCCLKFVSAGRLQCVLGVIEERQLLLPVVSINTAVGSWIYQGVAWHSLYLPDPASAHLPIRIRRTCLSRLGVLSLPSIPAEPVSAHLPFLVRRTCLSEVQLLELPALFWRVTITARDTIYCRNILPTPRDCDPPL